MLHIGTVIYSWTISKWHNNSIYGYLNPRDQIENL